MKSLWILLVAFSLCGCSLIPRITFSSDKTTPQITEKSGRIIKCAGDLKISPDNTEITCTKGFYLKDTNYVQKERKFTFAERVGNFFSNLRGWMFWIVVALIFLCPGVLGWVVSRVFSASGSALTELMTAIMKFRKTSASKEELDNFLRSETSTKTKQIVNTFRAKATDTTGS